MCLVTVESVEPVSPGFRRVTVQGPGLANYHTVLPADAFKLMLSPDGRGTATFPEIGADGLPSWPAGTPQPIFRAYTVRTFDPAARRLTFDVAIHGEGPAMAWLRRARRGDTVGLAGMRHDFHPGTGIDHHLIVADASGFPAVAAIVESLSANEKPAQATVYLQTENAGDQALLPEPSGVELNWVRSGACLGAGSELERAARRFRSERGRVQAWIAAEAGVVRALRGFALNELRVDRDDLHAVAYWKAGQSGEQRDAEALRVYQKAATAGLDVTDPAIIQSLEFA